MQRWRRLRPSSAGTRRRWRLAVLGAAAAPPARGPASAWAERQRAGLAARPRVRLAGRARGAAAGAGSRRLGGASPRGRPSAREQGAAGCPPARGAAGEVVPGGGDAGGGGEAGEQRRSSARAARRAALPPPAAARLRGAELALGAGAVGEQAPGEAGPRRGRHQGAGASPPCRATSTRSSPACSRTTRLRPPSQSLERAAVRAQPGDIALPGQPQPAGPQRRMRQPGADQPAGEGDQRACPCPSQSNQDRALSWA